jgi:hypothetical protein
MAVPGVDQPTAEVLTAPPADEVVGDDAEADWSPVGLAADEHGVEGGIGFAAWVEIEAGLVRDRVPPRDHDTYAQGFGVPAGEWAAAQGAWHARMMRDPRVGAAFGHAYQQALKRR